MNHKDTKTQRTAGQEGEVSAPSFSILPFLVPLCLCGSIPFFSGCDKAVVQAPNQTVEADPKPREIAYILRTKEPTKDYWYEKMRVILKERPATEKILQEKIAEGRLEVEKALAELLTEVRGSIEGQHKGSDKWSLLDVSASRGKKTSDIQINAEIGLTTLYAKRPSIALNNVLLDAAVAKLTRETGIIPAQQKGFNPLVSWTKENVSIHEAIVEVLASHGFTYRFTDVNYKANLRVQDYATREDFIAALTKLLVDNGANINSGRPAIIVTPRVKPEAPPPPPEKKKK